MDQTPLYETQAETPVATTTAAASAPYPDMANITSASSQDSDKATTQKSSLPPLTPADFRVYNRMAEHMDLFHNHFRQTWNLLYGACTAGSRPQGMSVRAFLRVAEEFVGHLEVHHSIEEQHIFPVLAQRMPAFKKELELLTQHKQIHAGLDKLEAYVRECRGGERELRLGEMKGIMESFGTVLWKHLDDEVGELGAENMRRFWSKDEMMSLPM